MIITGKAFVDLSVMTVVDLLQLPPVRGIMAFILICRSNRSCKTKLL